MEDNTDIAFLAASCEREMRTNLGGSSIRYNRTDFRRFLGNGQPVYHPQQHSQQYPQQPQYAPNRPYQQPQYAPVDNYIPEGTLPVNDVKLLNMPSNVQVPNNIVPNNTPNIESLNSFNIPDYNSQKKVNYLEDEETFREALIEEIKSLKNNIKSQKTQINNLTKLVNKLIVHLIPETKTDDNTDKS